ncbi:hypothetical protein Droror1_Dr00026072 [Drosera rotundifolia]
MLGAADPLAVSWAKRQWAHENLSGKSAGRAATNGLSAEKGCEKRRETDEWLRKKMMADTRNQSQMQGSRPRWGKVIDLGLVNHAESSRSSSIAVCVFEEQDGFRFFSTWAGLHLMRKSTGLGLYLLDSLFGPDLSPFIGPFPYGPVWDQEPAAQVKKKTKGKVDHN